MRAKALAGIALVLAAVPATAAKKPARALDRIMTCRALTDDAARLACFDRETTELSSDVAKGDVMVIDRAQAEADAKQRFGLPPRGDELFKGQQPVKTVAGEVASAYEDAYGQYSITLADGSRWQQVDTYPLSGTPRKGMKVTVMRAALGTFKMSVAGQAAIRVKRIG